MKTKLNSLSLAAALTLSAAASYGQNRVIANIPFPFHTSAGVQAAGQYGFTQAEYSLQLTNLATGKSSFLGVGVPEGNDRSKPPRLVFTCGSESGCALTSVRLADGRSWSYKAAGVKPSEVARLAVIYLESRQTE
jgi:hypothetical protein